MHWCTALPSTLVLQQLPQACRANRGAEVVSTNHLLQAAQAVVARLLLLLPHCSPPTCWMGLESTSWWALCRTLEPTRHAATTCATSRRRCAGLAVLLSRWLLKLIRNDGAGLLAVVNRQKGMHSQNCAHIAGCSSYEVLHPSPAGPLGVLQR